MLSLPHKTDYYSQNCSVKPLLIPVFQSTRSLMNCMSFGSYQILDSLSKTHCSPEIHSWKTHSTNLLLHFMLGSDLPSHHVFAVSYGFCSKTFALNLLNSDFHYCVRNFLYFLTVDVHIHWDLLWEVDLKRNEKHMIFDDCLKTGLDSWSCMNCFSSFIGQKINVEKAPFLFDFPTHSVMYFHFLRIRFW